MLNRPEIYSQELRSAIDDVDHLVQALDRALDYIQSAPAWDPNEPTQAELWLTGRSAEVEAYAADVLDDWKRGHVFPEIAASLLARHVETVKREMSVQLASGGGRPGADVFEAVTRDMNLNITAPVPAP